MAKNEKETLLETEIYEETSEVSEDVVPEEEMPEEENAGAGLADEESGTNYTAQKPSRIHKILKVFINLASIVLIVVLTVILTPRVKYYWAMHLVDNGDYSEAYDILIEISESYEPAKAELSRFVKTYESEELYYDLSEGAVPTVTKNKYEFEKNKYKKTTEGGMMPESEEYFYDGNGRISKKVSSSMYGEKTVYYEYDKKGNVIKETESDGTTTIITEKKYDSRGNLIEIVQTLTGNDREQKAKLIVKNNNIKYVKK